MHAGALAGDFVRAERLGEAGKPLAVKKDARLRLSADAAGVVTLRVQTLKRSQWQKEAEK